MEKNKKKPVEFKGNTHERGQMHNKSDHEKRMHNKSVKELALNKLHKDLKSEASKPK